MNRNKKCLVISLIIAILIVLFLLIFFFVKSLNFKDNANKTIMTSTKTTEFLKISGILKDKETGIEVEYADSKEINKNFKLLVEKKENINLDNNENVISMYDVSIIDSNNKEVKVNGTKLKVKIPYENIEKYTSFKILELSDNNEIIATLDASYENNKISFVVNHLSRYAIVGFKEEVQTSATTKNVNGGTVTTTKYVGSENNNSVSNQPDSTTSKTTTTKKITTTAPTTKKTTTTTKKTTTTTTKVKVYKYTWGNEKDAAGQQYLFIVDEDGNKVSGTVIVSYVGSDYKETVNVSKNGVLLIKDIVSISNVKGN